MWTSPIGLFDHRFDHCKTSLGFHSTGTVKPGTHPKPPKTKSWNLKNRRYFVQGISFFFKGGGQKTFRFESPTESLNRLNFLPLGCCPPQAVASSTLGTELKQVEVPWVSLRSSEVVTRCCFLRSLKWCFFFFFKWKKQDVMVGTGLKFWCLLSCFYLNRNESDMMLCDSIMTWCWGYLAGLALLGSLGSLLKAGIRVLNRPPVKSNKCKFRGSKLLPVSWNNQDASMMQPW